MLQQSLRSRIPKRRRNFFLYHTESDSERRHQTAILLFDSILVKRNRGNRFTESGRHLPTTPKTMNAKAKRFDVRDHVLYYWRKLSNPLSYAQACSSWKILHSAYRIQVRVMWRCGFVSHSMGESSSILVEGTLTSFNKTMRFAEKEAPENIRFPAMHFEIF